MQFTHIAFLSVVLHVLHLNVVEFVKAINKVLYNKVQFMYKPIKVVHRKTGIAGYFVETLTRCDGFFHHVLVGINFVVG